MILRSVDQIDVAVAKDTNRGHTPRLGVFVKVLYLQHVVVQAVTLPGLH